MKYVSIDIETTGLDPEKNQILTIGAVIEDTSNPGVAVNDLPSFHGAIHYEELIGSPFALNMNKEIISRMVSYQTAKSNEAKAEIENENGIRFYKSEDIVEALFQFCCDNGLVPVDPDFLNKQVKIVNGRSYPILTSNMSKVYITAAGKNFGTFDLKFLERLPRWKQVFRVRSRILDPAILFVDWKNDQDLPGLSLCKERAGLDPLVSHDAVDDARDVIELLRKKY